jgi:hypothetical protein
VHRSLLASIALSLALIAAVVPAVLVADPAPSNGFNLTTPAPGESATPSDDATPPDGVISVDPTFITMPPTGAVLEASGTPDPALPPTDALTTTTTPSGATLWEMLIALTATVTLILLAGRLPAVRRR